MDWVLLKIVQTFRLSVGPKSVQESAHFLFDFSRPESLRRNFDETMRHWTRRFTAQMYESCPSTEHLQFRNPQERPSKKTLRKHSRHVVGGNVMFDLE